MSGFFQRHADARGGGHRESLEIFAIPYYLVKVAAWSSRDEEFVSRASFAMMAWIAVHDKKAPDALFISWLALIEAATPDERNFVKKAVNGALRQIGKRNRNLRSQAIQSAQKLIVMPHKSAQWIVWDAIKELDSPAVEKIFTRRENRK